MLISYALPSITRHCLWNQGHRLSVSQLEPFTQHHNLTLQHAVCVSRMSSAGNAWGAKNLCRIIIHLILISTLVYWSLPKWKCWSASLHSYVIMLHSTRHSWLRLLVSWWFLVVDTNTSDITRKTKSIQSRNWLLPVNPWCISGWVTAQGYPEIVHLHVLSALF